MDLICNLCVLLLRHLVCLVTVCESGENFQWLNVQRSYQSLMLSLWSLYILTVVGQQLSLLCVVV